jgi:hypothetical protein
MKGLGMIEIQANKQNFYVLACSAFEMADAIATWAKKNFKQHSIETMEAIIEGDETDPSESKLMKKNSINNLIKLF